MKYEGREQKLDKSLLIKIPEIRPKSVEDIEIEMKFPDFKNSNDHLKHGKLLIKLEL